MLVRSPFPEERFVPWINRTVQPGETIPIEDEWLPNFLEGGWEPGDDRAKAAALALQPPEPVEEPAVEETAAPAVKPRKGKSTEGVISNGTA